MPVTIGQFDNVPAPGDGVQSAWAQELTRAVHDDRVITGDYTPTFGNFDPGPGPHVVSYSYRPGMLNIYGIVTLVAGWVGYGNTGAPWSFTPPVGFVPHVSNGAVPLLSQVGYGAYGIGAFTGFLVWNPAVSQLGFNFGSPDTTRIRPVDVFANSPVAWATGSIFTFHCSISGWFPPTVTGLPATPPPDLLLPTPQDDEQ